MKKLTRKELAEIEAESDPYARACKESGGKWINLKIEMPLGQNGGCGVPTYVEGTNGGMMPCGSWLTQLNGVRAPYYCDLCHVEQSKTGG